MKKSTINFLSYMMVITICMLSLSSCDKDPCKDVTCENGGTPTEDGDNCNCACAAGYEGASCETISRDKFLKTGATVTDSCTSTGYNNDLTAGTDVTDFVFSNLGNYTTAALVTVTVGDDGTSFSATNFTDATGRKFTVSGSISGSVISGTYTVTYSDNTSDTCTFTVNL